MKVLLSFLTFGLAILTTVSALSCIIGAGPCEPPTCCKSGTMTTDACGQCLVCAKDVDESCGGPFRFEGTCSKGLSCLRTCPQLPSDQCAAQTRSGNRRCVFPFTFRGKTYSSCTTDHSENGQAWCSYQVDSSGVAVTNFWGDCTPECFTSTCSEGDLFNAVGRCISNARTRAPLTTPHKIDPGTSNPVFSPVCQVGKEKRCICSPLRTSGASAGEGCDPSVPRPWCFLENIQDPRNPQKDCFEDVFFSPRWGRFVSNDACDDEFARSTVSGGPPGVIFD